MPSILILQKEAKEGKKDKDSDKEDEDAGKWGKIERKMNPFSSNRIPVNKDNKYCRKKGSKPMYETHHCFSGSFVTNWWVYCGSWADDTKFKHCLHTD